MFRENICERDDTPAMAQAMRLINGDKLRKKLTAKNGLLDCALQNPCLTDQAIVEASISPLSFAHPANGNWRWPSSPSAKKAKLAEKQRLNICSGHSSTPKNACTTTKRKRNYVRSPCIRKSCFLTTSGLLGWGDVLHLRAQSPTSIKKEMPVIHFWLAGGISQMDSFDPKPEANEKFRSPFKSISTNIPGTHVCEYLPLMAQRADQFLLIRPMTHKSAANDLAMSYVMTGHDLLPTIHMPSIILLTGQSLPIFRGDRVCGQ